MMKKVFIVACFSFLFFLIFSIQSLFAWTNCPPSDLVPNPQPVIVTGKESSCIAEADWVELELNEAWSEEITLVEGQSYWFSVSKCARARTIYAIVKDVLGNRIKFQRDSKISFCFKAPKTGTYTVSYRITELNGSYTYAITKACLSQSNCSP